MLKLSSTIMIVERGFGFFPTVESFDGCQPSFTELKILAFLGGIKNGIYGVCMLLK